ncbi:MAG: methyltransferase domain-containing protein [Acidobacteriota bacterium]|nr:methyltransferase domain-containing protein [Acidobacteriota bacterium]
MKPSDVPLLRCPACSAERLESEAFSSADDGAIADGVLWCPGCGGWYPIEDGLLELLSGPLAYAEDRARFAHAHEGALGKLGLATDPGRVDARAEDDAVRRQQEHFDWYADNPTQTYSAYEETPFWKAADAMAFGGWRREVVPGARLLDVACAQGRSTFQWMDLDIDVIGFDISKALVRQALDRYRKRPARARAAFFVADATRFPLVSGSVDYVVAYGVLHHLPDPAATSLEIARVLREGGVFFGSENNETVFRRLFDVLQKIRPLWTEEAGEHALISEEELRRWLEPAGFDLSIRTSVFVPPHLANLLSPGMAEKLLRATDRAAWVFPGLRRQGGLILVRGKKRA